MCSSRDTGRVIDLAAARARRRTDPAPRTIIVQIVCARADSEIHRQIGVTDSLCLSDLHDVLAVAFSLHENAPWAFHDFAGNRLDPDDEVRRHLSTIGTTITFHWGLWEFALRSAHSWPRDRGTPWALCVGGSGDFGDAPFDIAYINAELTGSEVIRDVLARTRLAVREIIERSRLFDLVPLLQAIDLERESTVAPALAGRLADLPLENDAAGREAFWVVVLALSCLVGQGPTEHIIEQIMAALGWLGDDCVVYSAHDVRGLCADSLAVLQEAGVERVAAVDKLDILRELLRSAE